MPSAPPTTPATIRNVIEPGHKLINVRKNSKVRKINPADLTKTLPPYSHILVIVR
jgi:hypothetical protein